MVRDYELMYIARPELDDEGLQAAVDSVEQLVNGVGGTVVHTTNWGRRRLAYEVKHLRDGHYMLLHLRMDGERVADLERALAIHETVFRHLLVAREAGDEEPETGDAAAAQPRQTVVAAADDDVSDIDDDEGADADADADENDDEPAALLAANPLEEEN
jgi:small subunit ribosomal protein S6